MEVIMADWCIGFHKPLEEYIIPPLHVYNVDQTGLYFQKLPNWMYVDKDTKHKQLDVKQMKDKTRVILMVCTVIDGTKVPLVILGKSKDPMCFRV